MDQNIIDYFQKNKAQYPVDVLVEQLIKAGYDKAKIESARAAVFDKAAGEPAGKAEENFWDFRTVKAYASKKEKRKDFFFGLLAPIALGFLYSIVVGLLSLDSLGLVPNLIWFALEVGAMVYFFKRRRYIFYGLIAGPILGMLIGAAVAAIFVISF